MGALNIKVLNAGLQATAEHFKERYDAIVATRERELADLRENYKPGTALYREREQSIRSTCEKATAQLRAEAGKSSYKEIQDLREHELSRLGKINEPLMSKIRTLENIPLTANEISAFVSTLKIGDDYWASRALGLIAEKNGIDVSAIGLESTLDTKLSVLDQLQEQLDRIISGYGEKTISPEEKMQIDYLYLSDTVLRRAEELFSGKVGKMSDSEVASKAFAVIKGQGTEIARGIAVGNALKNARGEVKNALLCMIADDQEVSDFAIQLSGHEKEILEFRGGKSAQYKAAVKAMDAISKAPDSETVELRIQEHRDNPFLMDMVNAEAKRNEFLSELLSGRVTE